MKTKKKKATKTKSDKYDRQNKLAAGRQQKYRDNMTDEKKEEYRKKARERYQKRKNEKKVKLITDLSAKEQKERRKKWKEDSKKYREKKKMLQKATEITPPQSEEELEACGPLSLSESQISRQQVSGRKKVRRDRAKAYREIKKKDEKIKDLERKLAKYKKKLQRQNKKIQNTPSTFDSPSPSKRVREVLRRDHVSSPVKRQLCLGLALEKQIKSRLKSVSPKSKESQIIRKVIGTKIIRKYRLQSKIKHILPYRFNKYSRFTDTVDVNYTRKTYTTVKVKDARLIQNFFEDDLVSKMCPGKKDIVKRGGCKKQRRILVDSMKNLYTKFVNEYGPKVSYTTFTRVRPFWVQPPNNRDRETCACVTHENLQLLVNAMKHANVLQSSNLNDIVTSTVCSSEDENCMTGSCSKCKDKAVDLDLNSTDQLKFTKWVNDFEMKVIKGVERKIKRTVKREFTETLPVVQKRFLDSLVVFKKHVFNLRHQAKGLKKMKNDLREGVLIFHIDFSQNYVCKYEKEIQATHFGASKRQVSLHTGLRYHCSLGETITETFCTLSDNLDHHAHAVWEHLKPILQESSTSFPDTHTVHIFSDSPSSQYRNRTNIYLMKTLLPLYFDKLNSFTWNFSEPGHGKGAMDGVGGSLKRTSDLEVKHGNDITCAADIVAALGKKSKTRLIEIPYTDIENAKELLPSNIPQVKGIMSIRQITCGSAAMYGRRLSCFDCAADQKCRHYNIMEIKCTESESDCRTKRKKLKVSDVYSSEDEIDNENGNVTDDSLRHDEEDFESREEQVNSPSLEDFQSEYIDPDHIQAGIFVIVNVKNEKNIAYRYAAVCSSSLEDSGEVEVTFLKRTGKTTTLFQTNDNDVSYVHYTDIISILNPPTLVTKRDLYYYKFDKDINVHQ